MELLGVLLAAGAIAFRFGGKVSVFDNEVSIAFLFTVISIFVWIAFYLMDRFWYHELLRSTVKYSESLEDTAKKSGLSIPLNMSSKIREANHRALKMFDAAKINAFLLVGCSSSCFVISILFIGAIQPILKNYL